jgi:HEAT repeat protein
MKLFFVLLSLSLTASAAVELHSKNEYNDFIRLANDETQSMPARWKALMSAASLRKLQAVPDIIKASKSSKWFMKNAAMVALDEYAPLESEKLARELIAHKALVVRSAAVDILAKSSDFEIRKVFWQELNKNYNFKNKKSLWIRPQIVKALSRNPQADEIASFSNLLKEDNIDMQMISIQALEKITGIKLGDDETPPATLVQLWKNQKIN